MSNNHPLRSLIDSPQERTRREALFQQAQREEAHRMQAHQQWVRQTFGPDNVFDNPRPSDMAMAHFFDGPLGTQQIPRHPPPNRK
jgi:hypothetical protein